jgi:Cft2 family RNA processing exonuclease
MCLTLRLTRLGKHRNDHSIEPSCGVLDIMNGQLCEKRIVVDCGQNLDWSSRTPKLDLPDFSFFQDGPQIDAVFITHAHFDHAGSLPALAPYLKGNASVFMTPMTAAVLRQNWNFQISAHERAKRNGRAATSHPLAYPISAIGDLDDRIVEIECDGVHDHLVSGIPVLVQSSGHISGACSFTFRILGRHVHYTGDRCSHDQPGVRGAVDLPPEWRPNVVAGSDCTYGDGLDHNPYDEELDRCVCACYEALWAGRPVLLYTFALHRAAVLAHAFQRSGIADNFPVYIDGSAARFAQMMTTDRLFWCANDSPIRIHDVGFISGWRDRERIFEAHDAFLVIAPPGMGGPGGSGSWWRRRLLPDREAVVGFTGYVAPGTDGDAILQAAKRRTETGHRGYVTVQDVNKNGEVTETELKLNCQVEHFRLGGHNGRLDTVQWFRDVKPEHAVLSHGSTAALARIEAELADSGIQLYRTDQQRTVEIKL